MIVDFKTSNYIYPSYKLQVAAYAKAFEEMQREAPTGSQDVTIKKAQIVRFQKDTPGYSSHVPRIVVHNDRILLLWSTSFHSLSSTSYEIMPVDDLERDFSAFKAALILFRWNEAESRAKV